MPVDLDDQLRRLTASWEQEQAPITLAELVSRSNGGDVDDVVDVDERPNPGSVDVLSRGEVARRPHRTLVGAGAALLAAVAVIAMALVALRGDAAIRTPADSTPPTVATSTAPSSTLAAPRPADRVPTPADAPVVPPPVPVTPPVTEEPVTVEEIDAERTSRFREFGSFRMIARVDSEFEPAEVSNGVEYSNVQIVVATLLADGSTWMERDDGWSSFDPATRTARVAFHHDDGTPGYQEIVGWQDNFVGINIELGGDPMRRLVDHLPLDGTEVEIVSIEHDGSPAWRVSWEWSTGAVGSPAGSFEQAETWVIDRATGLIVASASVQTSDGGVQTRTVTLSEVELDVELPEAFPGEFPADAAVDRSGDPAASAVAVDIDAAFDDYGAGLRLPLPDGAVVSTSSVLMQGPDGATELRSRTLVITVPDGFVRDEVRISTTVVADGGAVPEGMAAVGDLVCPSTDGTTCAPVDGPRFGGSGPLADWTTPWESETTLTVTDGAITVHVDAPDPDRRRELVESITLVGDD